MLDILDVASMGRHTHYFNQTRSMHIYRRARLIALLLAIAQTGWVMIDHLLLPTETQIPIAIGRVITSILLLAITLISVAPYDLRVSLGRLFAMVLILSGFQSFSNVLLYNQHAMGAVAGYQFFPFMIVSMVAIFPLSIVEVFVAFIFVIAVEVATQLFMGQFGSVTELNDLWLLTVLGLIAGWASVNQLGMLLGLYRQATRDPLTGLANRRQLMEQLESEVVECQKHAKPMALMIFDLDKFKHFNDTYGHAAGDIVLKQFSSILKKQTKSKRDLAGRFGGEEFLIMLPESDRVRAELVAEQICAACHLEPVRIPSGEPVGFTTSIGIAMLEPGQTPSDLISHADVALYNRKNHGRDGYAFYSASMGEKPES